jgi:CPA2 family monovalent cation:H+ antiporter-2
MWQRGSLRFFCRLSRHCLQNLRMAWRRAGPALVLGFLAERLRVPALVGYLLAGILIGPATPGFVADAHRLAAGRDRRDAADVRRRAAFLAGRPAGGARIALPGAVVQMGWPRCWAWRWPWWGWSWAAAGVRPGAVGGQHRGAAARAGALGMLDSYNGRIAVGWLVVEDLAMVLVLVLLPPLAGVLGGRAAPAAGRRDLCGTTWGRRCCRWAPSSR